MDAAASRLTAGLTESTHAGRATAVADAYRRSGGERWGVAASRFAETVGVAVRKRFGDIDPASGAVEAFIASLHVEDLALACACVDGHGEAWDHFVLTYRPELYRAARVIAGDAAGRELADSLYAELFGLPAADGTRRSLLTYFHGRSRLGTWLRSVLAQRHVDGVRSARRLVSLDDPDGQAQATPAAAPAVEPDVAARMRVAAGCLSEALARLDAAAKLRLGYYYVHGLTLAETGRIFGEHEATASRKLEKARGALRALIEASMAAHGLDARDVESWGDVAREAWDAALADTLGAQPPAAAAAPQDPGAGTFKRKRTP